MVDEHVFEQVYTAPSVTGSEPDLPGWQHPEPPQTNWLLPSL